MQRSQILRLFDLAIGMNKISSEIYPERNLRIHTVTENIFVKELLSALAGLYSSDNYAPEMNSLWDLQDADFSSFTQSDISLIRSMVSRHWTRKGKSRSALVVGQDDTLGMTEFTVLLRIYRPKRKFAHPTTIMKLLHGQAEGAYDKPCCRHGTPARVPIWSCEESKGYCALRSSTWERIPPRPGRK